MDEEGDFLEPAPQVIGRILPFVKSFDKNAFTPIQQIRTVSPLDCVSKLRSHEHAVLYYQDTEYVDLIDAFYIQSGLDRGEFCLYATQSEPSKIKERMEARGIRAGFYENENRLFICRLSDATLDKRGLSRGVQRILDYLLSMIDSRQPSRILSDPWVGNIINSLKIKANMEVEQNVHAAFQLRDCEDGYEALKEFNGSLICRYRTEDHDLLTQMWFRNHLLNHHKSIFVPREGVGIAFSTYSKYLGPTN